MQDSIMGVSSGGGGVADGNGYKLITSTSVSGTPTSIDFTGFNSALYDGYVLEFSKLTVTTDSSNIAIRFTTDGGSSWVSGATDYDYSMLSAITASSTLYVNSAGNSSIIVASSVGNDSGEHANGVITINDPDDTSVTTSVGIHSWLVDSVNRSKMVVGSGRYKTVGAVNGIQLMFLTGTTFISGEVRLYGKTK